MTRWDIDSQDQSGVRRLTEAVPDLPSLLLAAWVVARLLV
jgi:hypothetical protein